MPSGLLCLKSLSPSISNRKGVWIVFFIITISYRIFCIQYKQCRRRSDAAKPRRLMWAYTVCHCPFYGTLGIYGLKLRGLDTRGCFLFRHFVKTLETSAIREGNDLFDLDLCTVKLQWLEHRWLVHHGWFGLGFESVDHSSDSSRKYNLGVF